MKGQANKAIMRKAAFAQVAEVENPTIVVSQVLGGKNPAGDYRQLAKLAQRSGPGATAGLRTSTIDHAVAQSQNANGISFVKLKDALTDAPRGQDSVMTLMKKEGVSDAAFDKNFLSLVNRAAEIETNILARREAGALIDDPDQFFDLLVRVAGANIGGASAVASSSGAGLVIAGATVRTLRNLLEKVPASRIMDILAEAAENPAFMTQLLKKVTTQKQAQLVVKELRSAMIAAGIISVHED